MYQKELHVALALAKRAASVARRYYRYRSRVVVKANETPVTAADRAIEWLLVKGIAQAFPHDRIVGEEHGDHHGKQGRFWAIDPIDGTNEFIQKSRGFSTSLALIRRGQPVMGVVSVPMHQKIYYAYRGHGSHVMHGSQRKQLRLPLGSGDLVTARIGGPRDLNKSSPTWRHLYRRFGLKHPVRIGSASFELCSVADGGLDASIQTAVSLGIWDIAAGDVIVSEAGGFTRDFSGRPIEYRWNRWSVHRGVVSCSTTLMPNMLEALRSVNISSKMAAEYRRMRRSLRRLA